MEENFGIENPLEKIEEEVKEIEELERRHSKEEEARNKFKMDTHKGNNEKVELIHR